MPPGALIDTGAIISILDIDAQWHRACLEAMASVHMPLLTTEAVLTEFFYLIAARSLNMKKAWGFVRSGALTVRPIADPDLASIQILMDQYKDRPMDFADATLVHLANRDSVSLILTIDRSDFETYRIGSNKKFTILPSR